MNKDETPTNDDNQPVVNDEPENPDNVQVTDLSQTEQDALAVAAGGVEGGLTPNDEVEETEYAEPTKDEPAEGEATEEEEAEQPTGAEVEEDEAGVFNDPTVEDPGDFKPGDHSFTITVNGTRTKVSSVEQADQLAEDPDAFKDAKQLIRFMDKRSDMRQGIAEDRKAYEEQKAKFEGEQQLETIRNERLSTWANELDYLTSRGDIPGVKPEFNTQEAGLKWSTEFKDEPGVKERLAIMDYMEKESANRQKAGLPPMTSMIEAHNEMQLNSLKSGNETKRTDEIKQRQERGSRVAGSSPYVPSDNNSGEIVGTPGTLDDLVNELLLNG